MTKKHTPLQSSSMLEQANQKQQLGIAERLKASAQKAFSQSQAKANLTAAQRDELKTLDLPEGFHDYFEIERGY